jgi:hypothetical protein
MLRVRRTTQTQELAALISRQLHLHVSIRVPFYKKQSEVFLALCDALASSASYFNAQDLVVGILTLYSLAVTSSPLQTGARKSLYTTEGTYKQSWFKGSTIELINHLNDDDLIISDPRLRAAPALYLSRKSFLHHKRMKLPCETSHPNPPVPPTKPLPPIYRMKPPSSYRFFFATRAAVSNISVSHACSPEQPNPLNHGPWIPSCI